MLSFREQKGDDSVSNVNIHEDLGEIKSRFGFSGDVHVDDPHRIMYATDASTYREIPIAVTYPKDQNDIRILVEFAINHNSSLIPRGAGTSLAGQVVGTGIVVDVSRFMTNILEVNIEEKWVRVQPGVVLDELNEVLRKDGLFFSPETSTSNRCMIGGMVGNNSCGAHSLLYGSTRDHLISVEAILSDGSAVSFDPLTKEAFVEKCDLLNLEGELYRNIAKILTDPINQKEIEAQFPDKSIHRRNTGYAIDILLDSEPFMDSDTKFNFCKLLAGSEGTLAFLTEIKLSLNPLPPPVKGLICVHCKTLEDALNGNLVVLKYHPGAIELMDKVLMDLSKENITQLKNRFFIEGDPEAMLIIEFEKETKKEIYAIAEKLETEMRNLGYGYHFPVIFGDDIPKVWAVRKSGLGLLSNMPGDAKPVPFVEDVAVRPHDLPNYIAEFKLLLDKYSLDCVYYAHIATGELHLRPVLNLKNKEDVEIYRKLAEESAQLVKKFRGSLSGEHGDGRLRSEFIQFMIGEDNYILLRQIKRAWDPENIFNPGKIIDAPRMNTSLRYKPGRKTKEIETYFDFSKDQGFLRGVEKCNGSGDCRKSAVIGGIMCPTYMATNDEHTTTRARANILREVITESDKNNPFDDKELYDVLDLCLSCKGCKSECPSNVDMSKLKAEFLQHYYDANGTPFKVKTVAGISRINKMASSFPMLSNMILGNNLTAGIVKNMMGFAPQRNLPKLYKTTLKNWLAKQSKLNNSATSKKGKVYLFADEFTDYNDTEIGIKAYQVLIKLGYEVELPNHVESGRTYISKGLIRKAKSIANVNVEHLKDLISEEHPLIGIEPSAILTFRDEYPELVDEKNRNAAIQMAKFALMFDEFIEREIERGNITADQFSKDKKSIKLHGHCHQKAIASIKPSVSMLSLPKNYIVEEIKSGCCGMAGTFGYEKDHYELSLKIGELILFPEIRKSTPEVLIAAPGTSCRQQIKDGTGTKAFHPIEILFDALK